MTAPPKSRLRCWNTMSEYLHYLPYLLIASGVGLLVYLLLSK